MLRKDEAKLSIKRRKLRSGNRPKTKRDNEREGNSKSEIDEAVNNESVNDQATNNDGVDTAKTNGVDAINNVQPTVVKKDEAKQQ